ncbi:MAG: riboflavin synthase [Phycisphaerae bacterium]|nr:riboflavin synthase [Phycisphaerae bacterium]
MFTGLIRHLGCVRAATSSPGSGGLVLQVDIPAWPHEPILGESIAVDGCCLTVSSIEEGEAGGVSAGFDVVPGTLDRTTIGSLQPGDRVHLEPALKAGDPIGGHFVQGHVEGTGEVRSVEINGDDHRVDIVIPSGMLKLVLPRGSICVAGVSLTVSDKSEEGFTVTLVPTTLRETLLEKLQVGDRVNIETDMLVRSMAEAGGEGSS